MKREAGRVCEKARREYCPQSHVKKIVPRGRNDELSHQAKRVTDQGDWRMKLLLILEGEHSLLQGDSASLEAGKHR